MRYAAPLGWLTIVLFLVAACGDVKESPAASTATPGSSSSTSQAQEIPTPTPTPVLPGSITPVPASERYRLDLGGDVVVAFVEGLSPEYEGKVAYVTHVPSGSQLVLDRDGHTIDRHDGRGDGPGRLDGVLRDEAAMERIMEGLQGDEDLRPRESAADWVHSIQFGGITYLAKGSWGGPIITEGERALTTEDLGSELYRVAFRIDGYSGYSHQDGNATYLNPGTPIYAVEGYSPEFRLAALEDGRARLFEADTHPKAEIGGDLLDIRGKVRAIDILSAQDARTVLGTIEGERTVERIVEMVLDSPVDQEMREHEGPRYFLDLRLADDTSVVRAFWLESGELSRGIMTDPTVTLSVWSALGKENRPSADEVGPRISERLAARLGLAYLSFAVPEIVVTGKPHSPVVRLMLRSEYQAMKGSVPTADSDSFVWLVEAQGSWRDGGIVPKDKRRDYSIGLVALDADGGRRYGGSYGNSSLLPGRSQIEFPSPTPTPEPAMPGDASTVPEHIRLDLDDGVVVAFADDPALGRIAYVTHVPSGAQAVLDREGKVLVRHESQVVDGDVLGATLRDSDSMKRIRRGLGYQGVLIRDPVRDWIDGIHFGGASYRPVPKRGDGASTGDKELDKSDLGPVVYRVAFCLSCNIELPMGYQVQDGDATFLDPGTPIHGVDGFGPSERLAAIVDAEVLLYGKFVPTPSTETPTPVATPSSGTSQPVDHQARDEQRLREVMEEFPERMKTWIDQDTIVYLLKRHPHGSKGDLIAVALYLPTRTVKNYELAIDGNGEASIALYSERTPDSPEGRAASLRLEQDPRIADAALHLLTTVKRWSKK